MTYNTYNIEFKDLTITNKKGKIKFSPYKAAQTILEKVPLTILPTERLKTKAHLWIVDKENEVLKMGGEFLIEGICDEIAGDFSNARVIAETKRMIINELRNNPNKITEDIEILLGSCEKHIGFEKTEERLQIILKKIDPALLENK